MTEKNIFVYKFFLSLNISDFIFYVTIATPPPEKVAPSFENLVGGYLPPPSCRKGGGAHYYGV